MSEKFIEVVCGDRKYLINKDCITDLMLLLDGSMEMRIVGRAQPLCVDSRNVQAFLGRLNIKALEEWKPEPQA